MRELIEAVRAAHPKDGFFDRFEESFRDKEGKKEAYRSYEDAFRWIDPESWSLLKQKAVTHFRDHRPGNLKQGFFNQLNEAFAYRHLRRQGHRAVRLLPERGQRVPDIQYYAGAERLHCEIKTICISDEEIHRRTSGEVFSNVYEYLGEAFFKKLRKTIDVARTQIASQGTKGIVYLVVDPDDFVLDHYKSYRRELAHFAKVNGINDVHVKMGARFNRRMRLSCVQEAVTHSTR